MAKIFWSVIYSLGQISLGLLLHPYQTMQSLVQDKVFIWLSLLPSLILAVITLIWRYILGFNFNLNFIANLITCFCLYWQLILIYLLFRFRR